MHSFTSTSFSSQVVQGRQGSTKLASLEKVPSGHSSQTVSCESWQGNMRPKPTSHTRHSRQLPLASSW